MKTTSLFKAVALVAIMVASVLNSEVKAQDGFITNQVMNGELVASKTIFKQEGSYLQRHMQYTFTYDDQNRLISKEASKWDGAKDAWVPYFKMTYQYSDNEITMNYARWNESHKAYDEAVQKSVYELNDAICRRLTKPTSKTIRINQIGLWLTTSRWTSRPIY